MNKITYRISLDTSKNGIQRILQGFNEGDKVARRIEIALTNGGVSVPLPDTAVTALMYVTISGTASTNAVTIEEGKAIYEVDTNDTASAGIVDMNLKILDTVTGMVLYAPRFQIEVWENGIGSSTAATSETFTALESALAQAQLYSQSTIDSVYIDEDNIFTVEYKDESKYTSTVIADAITAFEEATEEVGDLAEALSEAQEYASSASASATSASTSASNASTSATSASASATSASESATSASSSATSASASKEAAATSASNASASATSASQSATSATASKEAAASSATSASQSATSASTSASSATASKNAAATSATSASTSASSALASKTAAESAATRAEEAATQATQGQKQADYEQTDDTQKDFIKNKPIIDILTTTSPTLTLSTSRGGIRLDKVVGNIHKSANIWDEEWEVGSISTSTGEKQTSTGRLRSANLISVKPNTTYYMVNPNNVKTYYYDSSKAFISVIGSSFKNATFTTPSNCYYVMFATTVEQTTYNNDIAIIEGTSGSYEPYGVLTSGMGCVDLGSLTWSRSSSDFWYATDSDLCAQIKHNGTVDIENYYSEYAISRMLISVNTIRIYNSLSTEKPNGLLAYELAESASADKYAIVVKEHSANLLKPTLTTSIKNGITVTDLGSGIYSVKGTATANASFIVCDDVVLKSGTYKILGIPSDLNGGYQKFQAYVVQGSTDLQWVDRGSDTTKSEKTFSEDTTVGFRFVVYTNQTVDFVYKPMVVDATSYPNITYDDYTPYSTDTTIIPISSPLTSYDSISEDGEYRAYGRVDLGSLTWTYRGSDVGTGVFTTPSLAYLKSADAVAMCENYASGGAISDVAKATSDKTIYLYFDSASSTTYRVCIKDTSYTDATELKTAMDGIMLWYPLATPTLTPLTTDQTIALHSLKAYDGKTYLDSADVYAKPTLSVGYSKVQSLALENENLSKVNARLIEDLSTDLQSEIDTLADGWKVLYTYGSETLSANNYDVFISGLTDYDEVIIVGFSGGDYKCATHFAKPMYGTSVYWSAYQSSTYFACGCNTVGTNNYASCVKKGLGSGWTNNYVGVYKVLGKKYK